MSLTHLIYRAYIAAARNEQTWPKTVNAEMLNAEIECSVTWEEPVKIAKVIYQVYGYTAREQFARGIIAQPGRIHNLLICAELRRVYGDLSKIKGFDANGNFIRERYNDVLIPEKDGWRITGLKGYATRQLAKQLA